MSSNGWMAWATTTMTKKKKHERTRNPFSLHFSHREKKDSGNVVKLHAAHFFRSVLPFCHEHAVTNTFRIFFSQNLKLLTYELSTWTVFAAFFYFSQRYVCCREFTSNIPSLSLWPHGEREHHPFVHRTHSQNRREKVSKRILKLMSLRNERKKIGILLI